MSSASTETFSPHNISVLGGLLFIALILGEVVFNPHVKSQVVADTVGSAEDIAMRLKSVVTLADVRSNLVMAAATADSANKTPDALYQGACFACHGTGAAGAPKLGDKTAWKLRIGKGMEALLSSAINGVGAMPPKGGSQYGEVQMRAVIEFMVSKSK